MGREVIKMPANKKHKHTCLWAVQDADSGVNSGLQGLFKTKKDAMELKKALRSTPQSRGMKTYISRRCYLSKRVANKWLKMFGF